MRLGKHLNEPQTGEGKNKGTARGHLEKPESFAGPLEVSQNDRMLGIGRDLGRSPSRILLPAQEHLHQVTQEHVQAGFESLQRRRLHNPPGQPVLVLCHPHRKVVLSHI